MQQLTLVRYFRKKQDDERKASKIKRKSNKDIVVGAVIKPEADSNLLSFGVAVCSNKDQFVKSKGRILAVGRATSHSPKTNVRFEKSIGRKDLIKLFVDTANEIYADITHSK